MDINSYMKFLVRQKNVSTYVVCWMSGNTCSIHKMFCTKIVFIGCSRNRVIQSKRCSIFFTCTLRYKAGSALLSCYKSASAQVFDLMGNSCWLFKYLPRTKSTIVEQCSRWPNTFYFKIYKTLNDILLTMLVKMSALTQTPSFAGWPNKNLLTSFSARTETTHCVEFSQLSYIVMYIEREQKRLRSYNISRFLIFFYMKI